MKIAIGSDNAGYLYKEEIKKVLEKENYNVIDLGPNDDSQVDYPDYAYQVSKMVQKEENTLGILICGTGIGMCIASNKVKGVRAALVTSEFQAQMSKEHNNSNILCLGARVTPLEDALRFVKIWLGTEYKFVERHSRRIDEISRIEEKEYE